LAFPTSTEIDSVAHSSVPLFGRELLGQLIRWHLRQVQGLGPEAAYRLIALEDGGTVGFLDISSGFLNYKYEICNFGAPILSKSWWIRGVPKA
jgi:hypothetical protein